MATCHLCGLTIGCSGDCIIFCSADCKDCQQWCDDEPIEVDAEREPLGPSAQLKACAKEVGPERLREALQAYVGTPLEWADEAAAAGRRNLEFSGSVEELLEQTGLRPSGGGSG